MMDIKEGILLDGNLDQSELEAQLEHDWKEVLETRKTVPRSRKETNIPKIIIRANIRI